MDARAWSKGSDLRPDVLCTRGFNPTLCKFLINDTKNGPVAQSVERVAVNHKVGGSNLSGPNNIYTL